MTLEDDQGSQGSKKTEAMFHPSNHVSFANGIVTVKETKELYCFICCHTPLTIESHLTVYRHTVLMKRFKSYFEDRGNKVSCKICRSEIEWWTLMDHADLHEITTWSEQCPDSKIFFQNYACKFTPGFCFCFLCNKFMDYWDKANSHFMDAGHRNRLAYFGEGVYDKKLKFATSAGFVAGKDQTIECKLCGVGGLKRIMEKHRDSIDHKSKLEEFLKEEFNKHAKREKFSDYVAELMDAQESTSKSLEPVSPMNQDKLKKILGRYGRQMICNFTVQENSDEEISEAEESTENPVKEKPSVSVNFLLEAINQNCDRLITYIVNTTSPIVEKKRNSKQILFWISLKKKNLYCLICDSVVSGSAPIINHLNGKRHKNSREKYGCDNILLLKGEHYWCTACDRHFYDFDNVYHHITGDQHQSIINSQNSPTESDCVMENFYSLAETLFESCDDDFTKKIEKLYDYNGSCGICLECTNNYQKHCRSYEHKIRIERCRTTYEDRGENTFCKKCEREIKWQDFMGHGMIHVIPPWNASSKPSSTSFYRNRTAHFCTGHCYCFLCDKFIDYWDTASSHFMEADHQKRKEDFGPIADFIEKNYGLAESNGILPGPNMTYECIMCNKTGFGTIDIDEHIKSGEHKINKHKTPVTVLNTHLEKQKLKASVSESLKTVASTSEPMELVPQEKNENWKKFQMSYKRNMICNFSIRENPENEIQEANKSSEIVPTKPINEKVDWPLTYIVCSTSPLCKESLLGTDFQHKSKFGNQNSEEPDRYCLICYSEIPGNAAVNDHLNGKQHEFSRQKYGCNHILFIEGQHYWCSCCECTLSTFENVYHHITSYSHLSANFRVHSNNPDSGDILEQVKSLMEADESSPCLYIAKRNAKRSLCYVCDETQFPVATKKINEHVDSQRHKLALKRYGCDNIVAKGDGRYYCKCCMVNCPNIEDLYIHIKEKKHMSSLIKFCKTESEKAKTEIVPKPKAKTEIVPKPKAQELNEPSQNLLSGYTTNQMRIPYPIVVYPIAAYRIPPYPIPSYRIPPYPFSPYPIAFYPIPSYPSSSYQIPPYPISSYQIPPYPISSYQIPPYPFVSYPNLARPPLTYGTSQYNIKSNAPMTSGGNSGIPAVSSISNDAFNGWREKPEEPQSRAQTTSTLESKAQANTIYCNFCAEEAEDTTKLHVHMVIHYADEFVRLTSDKIKLAEIRTYEAQRILMRSLTEPGVAPEENTPNRLAINGFSNLNGESSNWNIAGTSSQNDTTDFVTKSGVTIQDKEGPQTKKPLGRIANLKKVTMLLDFDENHIYDLNEKLADVEFGMMLGLVVDSTKMYCLICRKLVEYTLDNYYEHLENVDHCEYLEEMENDDVLFQDMEDQLSDLVLAQEYMEEVSENIVRCVICDEAVENNPGSLQAHIYHEIHERKCEETRAIARKCFEEIVPKIKCNWYGVEKYWCVVCEIDSDSEVDFVTHFYRDQHKKNMLKQENRNRRLFFDFCASCALLWYGYRCTHSYHRDINAHKWLERDGHYVLTELPKFAKSLLDSPEKFVKNKIEFFDQIVDYEVNREQSLIQDLESAAKIKFPQCKAHVFGSRISGLASPDSDIDIFLDCRDFYDGNSFQNNDLLFFIYSVHQCLCRNPQLWDVDELLTECRIPIIKATHRATELSCDISFENGLSVENTKLIKAFNQTFPLCRKITVFLKQWLLNCGLSGSRGITNYALCWLVIFYLQQEKILPSVEKLIALRGKSHKIAGWEVGVAHEFFANEEISIFTLTEMLLRFFSFYANFDFRYNVVCPLLGEMVEKREFINHQQLPQAMGPYIAYMSEPENSTPFPIDSPMCVQDPFNLQHNLTKDVNKVHLNRFRKCCDKSYETLCPR